MLLLLSILPKAPLPSPSNAPCRFLQTPQAPLHALSNNARVDWLAHSIPHMSSAGLHKLSPRPQASSEPAPQTSHAHSSNSLSLFLSLSHSIPPIFASSPAHSLCLSRLFSSRVILQFLREAFPNATTF